MYRALCIGINYPTDASNRLYGCCNDAANMASYFRRIGYQVTMLIDDAPTAPIAAGVQVLQGPQHTTRQAILTAIQSLREASRTGGIRTVAITYSGHGSQLADGSRDELDGKDEVWVPGDFRSAGMITDDQISNLVRNFHPETRLFLLSDACHSGTFCDLNFQYDASMSASSATRRYAVYPSRVVHVSGCRDAQTSADAWNVEGFTGSTGALTACFLATLQEKGVHCPLGTLLNTINSKLSAHAFTQRSLLTTSTRVGARESLQLVG